MRRSLKGDKQKSRSELSERDSTSDQGVASFRGEKLAEVERLRLAESLCFTA